MEGKRQTSLQQLFRLQPSTNQRAVSILHYASKHFCPRLLHNSSKAEHVITVQNERMTRKCMLFNNKSKFKWNIQIASLILAVGKSGFREYVPNTNIDLRLRQHFS